MTTETELDRFYQVHKGSVTYHALNTFEAAGKRILKALAKLDAEGQVPYQFTYHGQFKALTSFPKDKVARLPLFAGKIAEYFMLTKVELLQKKELFGVFPFYLREKGEPNNVFRFTTKVQRPLVAACESLEVLGFEPNWFKTIAGFPGAPPLRDAKNAVLNVHGYDVFPEAYKVASDWVVKLPPIISAYGNTFVPPETKPLSAEELATLTGGEALYPFPHNHSKARYKILNLPRFELSR